MRTTINDKYDTEICPGVAIPKQTRGHFISNKP